MAGGAVIVAAATASVFAQQQPFTMGGTAQPPLPPKSSTSPAPAVASTNAVQSFLDGKLPAALADGKLNLNVRARYEQDNETGVPAINKPAYAPTIRTRLGFTTAPLYGFQAMVEGVNVSVIGPEANYNAAGSNNHGSRPIVADPPVTRLDQAWAGYAYTNWVTAKVGEQQINVDNQRFIGDSAWRQDMQTFDAVTCGTEPLKDLKLWYGYLWDVHRVYGNVSGLPAASTDFGSESHLFNVSYSGWKYGRFVGYTYLLDLHNGAGGMNSCATYGGYFAGGAPMGGSVSVDYRAEFAWQRQYSDSPLRYSAPYYNLEAGVRIDPVAFGAGCENFGSGANTGAGGGRASFRTPLETTHPFNGWANVFLTIPADGLQDVYAYAQVTLPASIPLLFEFHKFDATYGGADYGGEFDAMISKKFGKHWTALAEYAYYQGKDVPTPALANADVDIQKFWLQVEFIF
jgi:hypothetical protein